MGSPNSEVMAQYVTCVIDSDLHANQLCSGPAMHHKGEEASKMWTDTEGNRELATKATIGNISLPNLDICHRTIRVLVSSEHLIPRSRCDEWYACLSYLGFQYFGKHGFILASKRDSIAPHSHVMHPGYHHPLMLC